MPFTAQSFNHIISKNAKDILFYNQSAVAPLRKLLSVQWSNLRPDSDSDTTNCPNKVLFNKPMPRLQVAYACPVSPPIGGWLSALSFTTLTLLKSKDQLFYRTSLICVCLMFLHVRLRVCALSHIIRDGMSGFLSALCQNTVNLWEFSLWLNSIEPN